MNRNIPLSIDGELLSEIDHVAAATKESRSVVMRRAIRLGLRIIKAGGSNLFFRASPSLSESHNSDKPQKPF